MRTDIVHRIGSALLDPRQRYFTYSLFLVAVGFYHFVTWPVTATDTDLWYHLTGGRYFSQTGAIPTTSFFSFVVPERAWVNYYWLFQVVVHEVFTLAGYHGLILLRTALFCATALVLLAYLHHRERDNDRLFYFTVIWVFSVLVFVPRGVAVRPHLFSYLFIVLFLYLLEFGSIMFLCVLPFLGALWVNIHGVEYPVACLILGAYFIESLWRLKREGTYSSKNLTRPFLILCAMIAILFTPHGLKLLSVPFTSTRYVSQFIYELRPLSLSDFFSFFGILLVLALMTGTCAARSKAIRITHILLFLGGVLLLLRGKRFINEYVLLSLPLLKAYPPFAGVSSPTGFARRLAVPLGVAFMCMPFFYLHDFFAHPPRYPLSAREIPEGVAAFLRNIRAEGTLLNHPNTGGYLEWALYPRVRIFTDMQVPFLFTDADLAAARGTFTDGEVLSRVIAKYRPTFISAPIDMAEFDALIRKHPEYAIVFFDDTEVLYAERTQRPALVREHELHAVNPFLLYEHGLRFSVQGALVEELVRLRRHNPDGALVNATLAAAYQRTGRYVDSIDLADAIIRTYPESYLGYKLKADALAALDTCKEASRLYAKAAARAEGGVREEMKKAQSACQKKIKGSR